MAAMRGGISTNNEAEPLNSFICPITQQLMNDPHMTSDGYTYELEAIQKWLETKDTSPMTGLRLASKRLLPNHTLRQSIAEWKANKTNKRSEHKNEQENPQSNPAQLATAPVQLQNAPRTTVRQSHIRHTELKRVDTSLQEIEDRLGSSPGEIDLRELQDLERKLDRTARTMSHVLRRLNESYVESKESPSIMSLEEKNEAFLLAVKEGDLTGATEFSTQGANKEAKDPHTGATAVIIAAEKSDLRMLIFLCDVLKVDVNAKNNAGDSALFYAIKNSDKKSAKLLLRLGAHELTQTHEGISLHELGMASFAHWSRWQRPSYDNFRVPNPHVTFSSSSPRVHNPITHRQARRQDPATQAWINSLCSSKYRSC